MKKKITYKLAIIGLLFITFCTSCLKKDLPDLPLWDGTDILLVNVEHRFNGSGTINGQPIVAYQKLTTTNNIDRDKAIINLQITVPQPNGQFTADEKAKVAQNHLWVYMNISTAATVAPVEGTPKAGDVSDLTKSLKYEVTAANGQKRVWTINVTSFTN